MAKFKVGDMVVGNEKANSYSITTQGWRGTVVSVKKNISDLYDDIKVKGDDGEEYSLRSERFDLAGPKTLADLQVGDIIVQSGRQERLVHARLNDLVFYSSEGAFDRTQTWDLLSELEVKGFTVKQPEPTKPAPVKLTVAQIAKKLGHEVEVVAE